MTNRWLLPDHMADVLPTQARQIEETRRALLDVANRYGFELVMPPLVEHLDSLLIGAGSNAGGALDLQTFKLVDQHTGRSLGVRADTTPQVARIDAHLLNRQGLTRLCYCGPVLHTRPATPHASREPLQFGAEIYGHAGLEADLEIMELVLASFKIGGIQDAILDLSDVRVVGALLAEYPVATSLEANIYLALAAKDSASIQGMEGLDDALRAALLTILTLYGDITTLDVARQKLPKLPIPKRKKTRKNCPARDLRLIVSAKPLPALARRAAFRPKKRRHCSSRPSSARRWRGSSTPACATR